MLTTGVVFVYGALRSGTTLLRLMLQAHPGITNPGEADFLFDYISLGPTGLWQYDKLRLAEDRIFQAKGLTLHEGKDGLELLADFLAQFEARASGGVVTLNLHRNIGRVLDILPAVRLVHILRDPRDVAQSSIGMGWAGTLYHGVDHWIATESAWDAQRQRLAPDQIIEFSYETLLTSVEVTLRQICDFLDCGYDLTMLDYHQFTTYGPPDASLVNQWQRRADRADLAPLEAKAAALMLRHGYALSGPISPPGRLMRIRLAVQNRAIIWRFGASRFGVGLYIAEKLTRWIGLSALHRHIRSRIKAIDRRHLK